MMDIIDFLEQLAISTHVYSEKLLSEDSSQRPHLIEDSINLLKDQLQATTIPADMSTVFII
jgi:hypothetical protein